MPGERPSVAIVGAGIGGLTAAIALADRGHAVTVFERRTSFAEGGAGIQLSPNASRVLFGLGLGPALNRVGCAPEAVRVRAFGGRDLGRVPLGLAIEERFGAPYLLVARPDLQTALLDATRSRGSVALRVGRTLVALEQSSKGVWLVFETASGREDATADLAIGADGLWSRTRALLGDGREPRFTGATAFRATIPTERAPTDMRARQTGLWLGSGRHVVHYPIDGGRRLNVVVVEDGPERHEGWSAPVAAGHVRHALSGAAEPLRALIDVADEWSAWSLFDLPARTPARGRVALIGDAAHPILPYLAQGGAMAVEDAAVLASSLSRAGADIVSALRSLADERQARIARVQAESRRNGRIYHLGRPLSALRDITMRRLGDGRLATRLDWLYGWRPISDT